MKLLFDFEYMEVGDEIVAIPMSKDGTPYNGMIKVSEDTRTILELIKESNTPREVLDKLKDKFPEESEKDLAEQLCIFLNKLIDDKMLDPKQ